MKSRPRSVTVISWFLIVMSVLGLLGSIGVVTSQDPRILEALQANPLPMPVQYGFLFGGTIITLVSGIGMLKGFNWGRLLYVGWSVLGFVVGIATSPQKIGMLPGGVLFLIICYFLFRPAAAEWFQGKQGT